MSEGVFLSRSAVRCSFVTSVHKHAHATVSNTVRSNIDQFVWESYHKFVVFCQECTTIVEVHHHTLCRFLQICSNKWWMTCFWWQLAHNITFYIMSLSLKKGCFEINVEKIPAIWQLIRNPGLVEAGESVCRWSFCLSWNPLSTHPRFCSEEFASICYVVLRFWTSSLSIQDASDFACRSKAKAKPQRRELASSFARTIPIGKRIWTDVEPGENSIFDYAVLKKLIHLLRHGSLFREKTMERLNSGESKTIFRNISCIVIIGPTTSGRKAWQEEEETREDTSIALIQQE